MLTGQAVIAEIPLPNLLERRTGPGLARLVRLFHTDQTTVRLRRPAAVSYRSGRSSLLSLVSPISFLKPTSKGKTEPLMLLCERQDGSEVELVAKFSGPCEEREAWHAYEALSLDLADADGIKDKARRWRGHLDAVFEGKNDPNLELNFILGAPTDPKLISAYGRHLGPLSLEAKSISRRPDR